MSATVFCEGSFRFYFFSPEEERMHIDVQATSGEAKFWLEPEIELAKNIGLRQHQLRSIRLIVEEHQDEIRNAWRRHFQS